MFDIALGELLRFTDGAEAVADEHRLLQKVRILSLIGHNRRKLEGTKCIGNYWRWERLEWIK